MKFLIALAGTGVSLLVLDLGWLTAMGPTYKRLFGDLLLDHFRMGPAVAFYALYVAGVAILVVLPAVETGGSLVSTGWRGALLGATAYGTYSLTNHATLKGYGAQLMVMDLLWGPVLTAISAIVGVAAVRAIAGPL